MGFYCLLKFVVYEGKNKTKAPLDHWDSLGTEYRYSTTDRQQYTPAHRHNTGGFGTPMLVLLLGIFQHRRRAGYRREQTHSCLRSPHLWGEEVEEEEVRGWGVGFRFSDRHNDQPSHSFSTKLFIFGVPASHPISSSRLSS